MQSRHLAVVAILAAATACNDSKAAARPAPQVASAPTPSAAPAPSANQELSDRADAGRIAGSPNAAVWFIEASDFQCPFCKRWHDETYPLILRDYVQKGK